MNLVGDPVLGANLSLNNLAINYYLVNKLIEWNNEFEYHFESFCMILIFSAELN